MTLTKRETLAGMAMQGLLASVGTAFMNKDAIEACAVDSVKHADALIAELERSSFL